MGITILFDKLNASKAKINVISGVLLLVLILITGFSPSVVRAGLMAYIGLFANILHRKSDIFNNLAIVLLITLIYNPYNINNMSVLLSYGGVLRNCQLLRYYK